MSFSWLTKCWLISKTLYCKAIDSVKLPESRNCTIHSLYCFNWLAETKTKVSVHIKCNVLVLIIHMWRKSPKKVNYKVQFFFILKRISIIIVYYPNKVDSGTYGPVSRNKVKLSEDVNYWTITREENCGDINRIISVAPETIEQTQKKLYGRNLKFVPVIEYWISERYTWLNFGLWQPVRYQYFHCWE